MASETTSYILATAAFILCLLDVGLAQSKCSFNRTSLEEGSGNSQYTCPGVSADHTVIWKIVNAADEEIQVATCPPPPQNCTVQNNEVKVTRDQLTINGPIKRGTAPRKIKCETSKSNSAPVSSEVAINVFAKGVYACLAGPVQRNSEWKLGGVCNFTNAYSSLGCYYCTWFETQRSPVNVKPVVITTIPPDQTAVTSLVTGADGLTNYSCAFEKELPSVDGKYSIHMALEHSRVKIEVGREFEIRNPSKPMHNCPTFVAEGESVRCTCESPDLGEPVRSAPTWSLTSNQKLIKDNVRRSDDGEVFTCGIQAGPSVSYTLRVAYGPDEVHIATQASPVLTCIPVHVNPTPQFVWTQRGAGEVGRKQTLPIDLANLTADWRVDCTVTNVENKGRSETASANIDTLKQANLTFGLPVTENENGDRFGVGLAIGVVVAMTITVAVFVTIILALRLRGWVLPCSHASKDQPKRQERSESVHPLVDAGGRDGSMRAPEDGGATGSAAGERGHPEGASNYDMLVKTQVQMVSPYESLMSKGAAGLGAVQSTTEDESGPLYANREYFMDSPVYVNSYPGEQNMDSEVTRI